MKSIPNFFIIGILLNRLFIFSKNIGRFSIKKLNSWFNSGAKKIKKIYLSNKFNDDKKVNRKELSKFRTALKKSFEDTEHFYNIDAYEFIQDGIYHLDEMKRLHKYVIDKYKLNDKQLKTKRYISIYEDKI